MNTDELRLVIMICKMYYLQDLCQNEIADKLFISRSQVSKLISKAKNQNILSIQIHDPFSEENLAAEQLKKKYHLEQAVVVDTRNYSATDELEIVAKNLSIPLTSKISNGSIIGVSAGFTIAACAKYTNIFNCKDLQFIPLVAGQSYKGESW